MADFAGQDLLRLVATRFGARETPGAFDLAKRGGASRRYALRAREAEGAYAVWTVDGAPSAAAPSGHVVSDVTIVGVKEI